MTALEHPLQAAALELLLPVQRDDGASRQFLIPISLNVIYIIERGS